MSHQVLRGGATALLIAAVLTGCTKKTENTTETATSTDTTVATTEFPTVNAPTPVSSSTAVVVPEMKPTGDVTQAVRPDEPTKKASGVAPQMTPTGNLREPYTPPATNAAGR